MFDEYGNHNPQEFNPQVENKVARENVFAVENKNISENISAKENIELDGKSPRKTDKIKARNKAMAALTSSLVGVVGLVVAGMTNLVNIKFKLKYKEAEYIDSQFVFTVDVQNMTEKEQVVIYQYRNGNLINSTTYKVDDVVNGEIRGSIPVDKEYIEQQLEENGNINIDCEFVLRGLIGLDVERWFGTFEHTIDKYTSYFNGAEGYCNCGVDGYYYFTMNFEDDHGLFSEFEAYIIDDLYNDASDDDKPNHISYWKPNGNLHDEQRIFVLDLEGSTGTLVIKYSKQGESEKVMWTTPIEL